MKTIPDKTGRFPYRIYYEQNELDYECEDVVVNFLLQKYGAAAYPIRTDDISILLEQKTSDFDQYADLSQEGEQIEGVTDFFVSKKPRVRISNLLNAPNRENRLRTTMTHELGHVHFHGPLLELVDCSPRLPGFEDPHRQVHIQCNRDTIINANETNWVEWQAGYASGAFLVPITPLKELVQGYYQTKNLPIVAMATAPAGLELIGCVHETFQVSEDAARVRLLKLRYLTAVSSPQPII